MPTVRISSPAEYALDMIYVDGKAFLEMLRLFKSQGFDWGHFHWFLSAVIGGIVPAYKHPRLIKAHSRHEAVDLVMCEIHDCQVAVTFDPHAKGGNIKGAENLGRGNASIAVFCDVTFVPIKRDTLMLAGQPFAILCRLAQTFYKIHRNSIIIVKAKL